jgi:hypothetical protein
LNAFLKDFGFEFRLSNEISSTILNRIYYKLATELFVSVREEAAKVTISNQIVLVAGDRVKNGQLTLTGDALT